LTLDEAFVPPRTIADGRFENRWMACCCRGGEEKEEEEGTTFQ
jgi:hypothetical protein